MKFTLLSGLITLLIACNNNKEKESGSDKMYLSQYEMNQIKVGETAIISVSYPQGTNYYKYSLQDSLHLIEQTDHEVRPGNSDEAGGSMGESFTLKAVKTGTTSILLMDNSDGAMRSKAQDSTWKNYIEYKVTIK